MALLWGCQVAVICRLFLMRPVLLCIGSHCISAGTGTSCGAGLQPLPLVRVQLWSWGELLHKPALSLHHGWRIMRDAQHSTCCACRVLWVWHHDRGVRLESDVNLIRFDNRLTT